jgi:hypothetical protein
MTDRENTVACPACGEAFDAVEVICETGRCPHCDTPTTRQQFTESEAAQAERSTESAPTPLFEQVDAHDPAEAASNHYEMEVDT